jgi:hypothetical protein
LVAGDHNLTATVVVPNQNTGEKNAVREFRLHGFGRGAASNDRPYRALF